MAQQSELNIDCKLSEWSAWSPCSQSCGPQAVQQRTRSILIPTIGNGKPCAHRVEQSPCKLLACQVEGWFSCYKFDIK